MSDLTLEDIEALPSVEQPEEELTLEALEAMPDVDEDYVVKEEGASAGEAFVRGAARELLPYWQDPAEHRKKRSGTETLAEIAGNLGANIAAGLGSAAIGAKLGAEIGTVVAPGAGTVLGMGIGAVGALVGQGLYAIYSGIGEEYLRSQIEHKDFSGARAAGQVALALNPILKTPGKVAAKIGEKGAKITMAGRVIGQGTGAAALEYDYTEDPLAAAVAGVMTTGVTFAFRGGMTANQAKPPVKVAKETLDSVALPGQNADMANAFTANLKKVPAKEWKVPKDNKLDIDFKSWLLNVPAMEADPKIVSSRFADVWKKLDNKEEVWKSYKTFKVQEETAKQMNVKYAKQLGEGGELAESTSWWGKWFKDAYFIAESYDAKMGTNLQGAINEISKAEAKYSNVSKTYYKQFLDAQKATKKLKINNTKVTELLELDPDAFKALPKDVQEAVGKWRKVYDTIHQDIGGNGYNIGYIQAYVPAKQLQGADLAHAVKTKVNDITENLVKAERRWLDPDDKDVRFLRDLAARYLPINADELQIKHLHQLPKAIVQRAAQDGDIAVPSSLFTRRGEIPMFARERDAGKLAVQYVNSNLRSVYMDAGLKQIRAYQRTADLMGQGATSAWLKAYLKQQTGGSQGLGTLFSIGNQEFRLIGKRWMESDSYFKQQAGKMADVTGDWISWTNSLVYPAYLGANLQASLRNMTQPLMVTAPTLGGQFGYKMVTGGAIDTLNVIRKGGLRAELDSLRNKGILGQITKTDIMTKPADLAHTGRRAIDATNDVLMSAYSMTDELNRIVTYKSAGRWVKAISEGDPAAIKALKELGSGKKTQLRVETPELLDPTVLKGSQKAREELTDSLADWMITRTQFQYGPTQQAHFARMAGPLFSMFTKWPVMIGSDVAHTVTSKPIHQAASKLMQRYGYGYMALMAVDQALQDSSRVFPELDYAVGKPTRLSPLEATWTWSTQGPAVQMLSETIQSVGKVASGKEKPRRAAARAAVKLGKSYFPVGSSAINEADRFVSRYKKTPQPSRKIERSLERMFYNVGKKLEGD